MKNIACIILVAAVAMCHVKGCEGASAEVRAGVSCTVDIPANYL